MDRMQRCDACGYRKEDVITIREGNVCGDCVKKVKDGVPARQILREMARSYLLLDIPADLHERFRQRAGKRNMRDTLLDLMEEFVGDKT